jgi:hypothetical protein
MTDAYETACEMITHHKTTGDVPHGTMEVMEGLVEHIDLLKSGVRDLSARPRAGQAAFNALVEIAPDFAEQIRGGPNDAFYTDGRVAEMLAAYRDHLLGPATAARIEKLELELAVERGRNRGER